MNSTFRICALSLAIAASAVSAQEEESTPENTRSTWRENVVARCTQQYSAEQCADSEFLEENFHVNSLEIAHRAAMRRNQSAEKAMHEVILQHACNDSPSKVCGSKESAQCIVDVTQTCAKLKREARACVQNIKNGCASTANPSSCFKQQVAQCPSEKELPIAKLLAKYPKLSEAQKVKLTKTAAQLDAKTSGWWSNLVDWLTTPLS